MPEISSELAARIDTLRASHAENPARFFMPLASAYREAGEVGRAEELLRENLKRHPGYLSAHVLLGRCLADRGAYAEARNEFQYVLSVDGQNLIALRTLGDMAAGSGDPVEARRWYGELLSVDPMNTEARNAVAALENAAAAPPAGGEQGGFGMVDIAAHADEADLPSAGNADPGAWGSVSLEEDAAPAQAPSSAGMGDDAGGFDALDFGAVDLSVADEQPEQSASAAAEVSAARDASTAEEPAAPQQPAWASGGGFDAWGSVDDGQMEVEAEGVEPLPLESFYDAGEPEAAAPAHHDDHEEHGEVVTETIAELYAQQGFPDRAAEVYRELIARNGEDPALVRRLNELEEQVRGGPAGEAPGEEEPRGGFDTVGLDGGAFEPIDLDVPSAGRAEPASAEPADAGAGPSAWLESVDAFVAGEQPAAAAGDDVGGDEGSFGGDLDLPAAQPGGDFDFAPDEDVTADAPAAQPEMEPAGAQASASAGLAGDAFADSFADGFDGAGPDRREWEAPTVEETDAAPELERALASHDEQQAAAEPSSAGLGGEMADDTRFAESPSEVAWDTPATSAATSAGRVTIASYLTSILAWRPGAGQAPAAASSEPSSASSAQETQVTVVEDAGAPPPARPWDDETLGAPVEQPPMDEPWIADAPAASSSSDAGAAGEPWTAGAPSSEDEPWAVPAGEPQTADPWNAPASADDPALNEETDAGDDLPWLSTEAVQPDAASAQGTEPAAAAPDSGDAPMPWESFDLSPEVPQEPTSERAPPRQEPSVEPTGSGFSFEDFFAEQPAAPPAEPEAAAPAPMFEAAPLPEPPAPPAAQQPAPPQQGGDEDEDLESFQAWLQSLKR